MLLRQCGCTHSPSTPGTDTGNRSVKPADSRLTAIVLRVCAAAEGCREVDKRALHSGWFEELGKGG